MSSYSLVAKQHRNVWWFTLTLFARDKNRQNIIPYTRFPIVKLTGDQLSGLQAFYAGQRSHAVIVDENYLSVSVSRESPKSPLAETGTTRGTRAIPSCVVLVIETGAPEFGSDETFHHECQLSDVAANALVEKILDVAIEVCPALVEKSNPKDLASPRSARKDLQAEPKKTVAPPGSTPLDLASSSGPVSSAAPMVQEEDYIYAV